MKKILLFSSLCKPKEILEVALPSWLGLQSDNFLLDILLYDDNNDDEAKKFTKNFTANYENVELMEGLFNSDSTYAHHNWNIEEVDRIIKIKNEGLTYGIDNGYDFIFLVDADLVLHPQTLSHLYGLKKDFVFEIFWTVFTDQLYAKPNCWDVHSWNYYGPETILNLKNKGTFPIGAGGACTLISKESIIKGLNFNRIKNLPYGGEDRHFCTRAEVLGIEIFVDTHFPAYHIFTKRLIKEAKKWYSDGCNPSFFDLWLQDDWKNLVSTAYSKKNEEKPKNQLMRFKMALYKARRSYINYLRYN